MSVVLTLALASIASVACAPPKVMVSTTVRSMTATAWIAPPAGASPAAPVPEPPLPADKEASAATPVAPPVAAPVAPPAATGGLTSHYYVTYWEGKCGGMFGGCGRGDTKVKRCKVAPDNTVTCTDEANATKALMPN